MWDSAAHVPMNREYRALVAKVEAFTSAAFERRRADMACAKGCSSCCEVSLTVSGVEAAEIRDGLAALSAEERVRVTERAERELAAQASLSRVELEARPIRCVMLEDDGRCIVYERRPLLCRTQGHALRYPAGFIPEAAVRARSSRGDVTHCPLNFTASAPNAEDVLDAERVDQMLSIVASRFAAMTSQSATARTALVELALGVGTDAQPETADDA